MAEVMDAVGRSFWPELAGHFGAIFSNDPPEFVPPHVEAGQGVLVIAPQSGTVERLNAALEEEGLRLTIAPDAGAAYALLKQDEDIAVIISGVPEDATLLPPHLAACEVQLRDGGMMSDCLTKPVTSAALASPIYRARSR